jgi:hypothetical protein
VNLEALKAEREKVQAAIDNILEAGQEFQTRDGRVKFANLSKLYDRLAYLDNAIAAAEGNSGYNTAYLKFGGFD